MADLVPGEGELELAFGGNQDDDDAEDASPGSKELAAMVEAAAAASVELDAAADRDDRTPRDGMVFKSYEEVLNFYKRYALRTGFGVCVKKSSFTKAGLCRRLLLVCNRWGNGKDDACYQARPTAKTNCQATVVARLWGDGLLHLTDVSLDHNHPLNPSAARFLRCYKTLPSGMSKDLVVRAARGECSTSDVEAPTMFDDWGRLKIREGDDKYKMEQQDDFESLTSGRVLVSKFPMEEQISKLYTLNMFVKFQDELNSTLQCQVQQVSPSSFVVMDLAERGTGLVTRKYEVVHCMETNRMECNCGLFQLSGIVCRHALSVLKWQQVYDIPPCYVLNRWRSDFKQLHALDNPLKDPLLSSNHVERYDHISLQCLRLVEIGMVSDDKYQHALKLINDMKRTLLDDNLCRELEQKISPPERTTVMNGDGHAQPGSSEGGPAKKRRGRPSKKSKEISAESVSNQCGNKESLLVSSDVSQKGALHSSSTASNLGTHVRAHGIDDLMEEVNANEVSFESRYGVQSSHPNHYGDELHPGHTLQFLAAVESFSRFDRESDKPIEHVPVLSARASPLGVGAF
ncbi:protein FAR1-RELATED SEQUENCE 6-like [Hordeum vulgare]|nr:protein FAR1-RELATED SEQUENCE 6-like [Hordeum vulgare]